MLGALINWLGIIVGGLGGTFVRRRLSTRQESAIQGLLGVFTIWIGLSLAWRNLNGSPRQVLGQLGIVMLAMALGKGVGKLLGLQSFSNSIGRYASHKISVTKGQGTFDEGLRVGTALFCAAPLAILASVQEAFNGFSEAFIVKAVMDGLAAQSLGAVFGQGVTLSAIPVLAYEAALIRGAGLLEPFLRKSAKPLIDSINATDGLLIFCVGLVLLRLKRIELADYLPSLAIGPLLMWWLG